MVAHRQWAQRAKSWAAKHPLMCVAALVLVFFGPFLNKAVHIDDPLFIWTAQHIQAHPADFYGFNVNWTGAVAPMWLDMCNPPLLSYLFALTGSLFGWHEAVLHAVCLLMTFGTCAGIYQLARSWCESPLLVVLLALVTPVFLLSGTGLMCDMLMLGFWVWAVVFFESGLKTGSLASFIFAGFLAGLSVLSKYSAVSYLPVLLVLAALRTRRAGYWMIGILVPVAMIAIYEYLTSRVYEMGLFQLAAEFSRSKSFLLTSSWGTRSLTGLTFLGGSLLSSIFFAPGLWRAKQILAGAGLLLGAMAFAMVVFDFDPWGGDWLYKAQGLLFAVAGMHVILLVAAELRRKPDAVSIAITMWILCGLIFSTLMNWTISARSLLPVVPPVAILLARRLSRNGPGGFTWTRLGFALVPAALLGLCLAGADCQSANLSRDAAKRITAQYGAGPSRLYFQGHWGFQYYMQRLGAHPLDFERATLEPGDLLAVPGNNYDVAIPAQSTELVGSVEMRPLPWVGVMDTRAGAGFYAAEWGALPFAFASVPPVSFQVLKMTRRAGFRSLLHRTQDFSSAIAIQSPLPPPSPGSAPAQDNAVMGADAHVRLALLLANRGRTGKAVQHYRAALEVLPDDPVALNNLAWILATSSNPEFRDGREAVRLATQAADLTQHKEASVLGTLAAAYAQAGQFSNAVESAQAAIDLANATGRGTFTSRQGSYLQLYRAGKTAPP
ncbi:MAG TPA: glycosyltransferase family 39 protein [Verrucomicrobiae bacterium]|nr:glycosyltransferase family 39 protein [Verrucomicrobiae bacterium]